MDTDGGRKKKFLADLYSADETVKWAAVNTIGAYVSELAEKNRETARDWMRRFMWQLNEESGGIGWGAAEAMGEAMAQNEGLAREFAHILVSYLREDGNYLEYEPLQKAVLWGIARVAQVRPEILESCLAIKYITPFLNSPEASLRGLAVWALGWIGNPHSLAPIRRLLTDPAKISFFNGAGPRDPIHSGSGRRRRSRKSGPEKSPPFFLDLTWQYSHNPLRKFRIRREARRP